MFGPLEDDDADLRERLSIRFLERLTAEMSANERSYADGWDPPTFEVGVTASGIRVLRIGFAGAWSAEEWDGSEPDAFEIVDIAAETSAWGSEADYWEHGDGWKEWSGDGSAGTTQHGQIGEPPRERDS